MSHNHIRPWRNIYRRTSRQIMVGNVPVGGDAPISVQTMTNTDTTDVAATVAQVQEIRDVAEAIPIAAGLNVDAYVALGADSDRHPVTAV